MGRRSGWAAAAAAAVATVVGGVVAFQALLSGPRTDDHPPSSQPAAVVGLEGGDVDLDLGPLDATDALATCATPGFVAGDPDGVAVLYGQRQVTATDPTGSFVLRNRAGKLMFCDMFGDDRPAVLPVPVPTASNPAVLLTSSRRDWSCAGPQGDQVARVRTNLWLAVTDAVASARSRFVVDGVPGPWFGSDRHGGYLHLQSWLASVPVDTPLQLETEVLDSAGAPLALRDVRRGPQPLLVACGAEIG